ncbi:MAG: 4-oxalocrotonate tautomerase family protein [Promethearchaeota archaeon]
MICIFNIIHNLRCCNIPIIHGNMWKGISEEKVKEIISRITKAFVDMDIPARAVEVIVHEIPKTHWGIGGKPATDARPDAKPP